MAAPRYREEFLLGTGGMAEVWRAYGPLGAVALKRLLPHAARNPSLVAAFEREGRLLQRILHPNVVGIHEVTRDERGICLVLEYVDGADLRTLGEKRVPERIALRIARDVLRALEAVHGLCDDSGRPLGLIHRDLSPSNVLVSLDGKVKLTDFGIARAVRGTHATTGINVKGTLAYLAPEQASGASVDSRTDLFAAGALLYEMLCGAPIYDDLDPRVALARARAGDVKSLGIARPGTAMPVIELVDRALSASPTDRFATATMMLAELERVAEQTSGIATDEELANWSRLRSTTAGRSGVVTPAGAVTTLVQPRHSRRSVVLAAGAVLVVGAALWVGARGAWHRERAAQSVEALSSAKPPKVVAVVVAPPPAVAETAADPLPSAPPAPADEPSTKKTRRVERPHRAAAVEAEVQAPAEPKSTPESRSASKSGGEEASGAKSLLDIGSEPGFAYVTIDGVKVGATPLFGREVTPGTHRIQVSRDGLGSKSFTIEVRPGDRISRVVKLP